MQIFIIDTKCIKIEENLSDKYYFEKDKLLNYGSKLIKKKFLDHLGFNHLEFILKKNQYGKPYYQCLKTLKIINFNISHDNDKVVLFYNNNYQVGIDIMHVKQRKKFFFKNIINNFTEEERKTLNNSNNFIYDFYKLWTFKESYFKYLGTGIDNKNLLNINFKDFILEDKISFKLNDNIKIKNFIKKNNIYLIIFNYESYIITICFDIILTDSIELININ